MSGLGRIWTEVGQPRSLKLPSILFAEPAAPFGIGEQGYATVHQRVHVTGSAEQARLLVSDQLGKGAGRGGDDRHSVEHPLEGDQAE